MAERSTYDITNDLRLAAVDRERTRGPVRGLMREAADKLDGLIEDLAIAENARDRARDVADERSRLLATAQREADLWWRRSEKQVDVIADRDLRIEQLTAELAAAEQATTDAREDIEQFKTIVDTAQKAAIALYFQDRDSSGSGRMGYLNDDDLRPLFAALRVPWPDLADDAGEALAADVPAAADDHEHPGGYLSTACLHDLHEPECGAAQRARGDHSHPHCKYCGAKCVCPCHTGGQVERAERVHVDGCTLAADDPHHAGWCVLADAGVPAAGEAEVDHAVPGGRYAWRIEFWTGAYWETFDQGIRQSTDLNAQGVAEATAERVEALPEQWRPAWRVLVWPVLAEPQTDGTAIARVTSAGKRLARRLAQPAPVVSGADPATTTEEGT